MGGTPQLPRNMGDASGFINWCKWVEGKISFILEKLNNPFANTGLSVPGPGTTQVDGNLVVLGNFTALGKISNDALTNPSAPQAVYDSVTTFGLTTTLTNIKTTTIPVPAGFTSASITLTVRCYAINNTAGLDYLYSQANINGYNGYALPTPVSASGGSGLNVSQFAAVLSGSSLGSNLVLQIAVQTAFGAWASSGSNIADLAASITWYR